MNDLEELRAFRDEIGTPGRERLAPGRERLIRAATDRRRTRYGSRVPGGRLAAAACATVAVACAGGTAVAVLQDGSPSGTSPTTITARPVSARVFLERAATAVESRPDRRPADTQWIYTKVFTGEPENPSAPDHARWIESWIRFDGAKTARYARFPGREPELRIDTHDPKELLEEDSEERSPAGWYDYLRGLPGEPSALLKEVYRRLRAYEEEIGGALPQGLDQMVFQDLASSLAEEPALPHSGRATVYRAVGEIPGVQVRKDANDALGRPGIAVTRTGDDGIRHEFVLAPGTYDYLGMRSVATRQLWMPYPPDEVEAGPGPRLEPQLLPAGKVIMNRALEAAAIVNEPGARS